jgi:hypothetical protein
MGAPDVDAPAARRPRTTPRAPESPFVRDHAGQIEFQKKVHESDMQCIVCYEPLVGKIFQCLLGSHNVCESCCENIRLSGKNACPIDRTPGGFIPNPRLEKEIALLTQICVNEGCPQKVLPWTMETHLETCEFTNFKCPLCHSMVISDSESDDAEAASPSTTSSASSSSSASPSSHRAATGCFFERHLRVACIERFVPTQLVSGGMRLTQGQSNFHRQDPMHFVLFKSLPGLPSSNPPILYEFSAICLRKSQGTGRKSMKVTFSSGGGGGSGEVETGLQLASGVIETTTAAASNSMPNLISNDAYIPNLIEAAARNPGGDAASASSSSTPIAMSNLSSSSTSSGASSSPQRLTFTLSVSPTRPSAPRPGHIEPFSSGSSSSNSSGSVASSAVTSLRFSSPVRLSMTNSAASPSAQAPIALVPSSLSAALANHAPPLPPPRSLRDRGDVCSTIVQVPCWRRAKPTSTVPAAFLALPSANTTLALIGAFNVGDLLDSLDTRNVWCEAQVRFTQRSIQSCEL